MDDLISRQVAINDLYGKDPSQIWDTADIEVWLNTLPSVQPDVADINVGDTIYRQAVLKLLSTMPPEETTTKAMLIQSVKQMDAAQPIIHCKDCKNSEHWYRDRRRCFLWSEDGIDVFNDGFCNYAERRQDD